MNIINEFFVSFILIKLYFKFKVCRKIKFPLLWKFYFSKWKFYFSADNFFPLISYQQILGIILSGIFVIFYPLVLFLHLINYGDLLNFILDEFFKFKIYGTNIHIPFWIFISYLIASLISVRFKYLAFLCIFANFIPFIMIVI